MGVEDILVQYPLKDVLDRIEGKVDAIDTKLDLKADRDRLHDMANRVATLELLNAGQVPMFDHFRQAQVDIDQLKTWRNRVIGAAGLALFFGGAAFLKTLGVT